MKEQLELVLSGNAFSVDDARELMLEMLREPIQPSMVAAILGAFRCRGVTVDELDGFSQALMSLATPLAIEAADAIDVCGTGGDGRGTFNISTCAAFVIAAAGYKVVKHGNQAVSSTCGSSDVLRALGVSLRQEPEALREALVKTNICFLHAPLFHPALRSIAPIRRELKVRTVFNMLGPLINPASPGVRVHGVYDIDVLRLYGELLARRTTKFAALCSHDGYDEVTLTSPVRVFSGRGLREYSVDDFGCSEIAPDQVQGGASAREAAEIVRRILRGEGTMAQRDVVAANAGLAIWVKEGGSLRERVAGAREVINSGAAYGVLENCVVRI